ncbi:MAG: glycerophosphodiester phosphodiesterase [Alphaproteobacteria bacterium]|nr:glycerophosphodiester phosphodiesterase [Alphaproteobacteria bacterium]
MADAGPIVIGHRGASGERPEHTLEAYARAIDQGADFIEPDLVMTKDGVVLARHENEIGATTDVASQPAFADRHRTKRIDGVTVSGYFTEDFTLTEIATLRARERIPALRPASARHDGAFAVPTLAAVIALVEAKERETGRPIGIYPETKHPSYFASIGLAMEPALASILVANGRSSRRAGVIVQSFEAASLVALRRLVDVRLVQLLGPPAERPWDHVVAGDRRTYADLARPAGLAGIAAYADGIGPAKELIVPWDAANRLGAPTALVADAHGAGLLVHPYSFRNENAFLPEEFRRGDPSDPSFPARHGDAAAEYALFFAQGIDGVFSDFPATAIAARDALSVAGAARIG